MLTRPHRPLPYRHALRRTLYPKLRAGGLIASLGLIPKGDGLRQIRITISADTTNFNVYTAAGSPAGPVEVLVTINSGIYAYSTSIATPGFDVGVGWAVGSILKLINNGYILGKGGRGVHWSGGTPTAAESGGDALKLQANVAVEIDNLNGYIAGGGAGGGGVTATYQTSKHGTDSFRAAGGGGAGGGNGGDGNGSGVNIAGGAGGGPGASGANGGYNASWGGAGGAGGGRILPGTGGVGASGTTDTAAQGGGSAGGGGAFNTSGAVGGTGGSADNVGGNGSVTIGEATAGGGGGGWGAAGGTAAYVTTGAQSVNVQGPGAGGKAVNLNGQTVTWINNGTRYGAIS